MTDNPTVETKKLLVWITEEELLVLDGKARAELQEKIDVIKNARSLLSSGLSTSTSKLVAEVLAEAARSGRLVYYHRLISHCFLCGKDAGYVERGKNGRILKNPRRKHLAGKEFAYLFVTVQGSVRVGGCSECVEAAKPEIIKALAGVKAEVPESLTGVPPTYKWSQNVKCTACDWEGCEAQMGEKPALISGTYPANCPSCTVENSIFGRRIVVSRDGFTLLPVLPVKEETPVERASSRRRKKTDINTRKV